MATERNRISFDVSDEVYQQLELRGPKVGKVAKDIFEKAFQEELKFSTQNEAKNENDLPQKDLPLTIKSLQMSVDSLNETAQFRQLTRTELLEYIAIVIKHAPEIEKQHKSHLEEMSTFQKNYSDKLTEFFKSMANTMDGLGRIDSEVKKLGWVVKAHENINKDAEKIAAKAAETEKIISNLGAQARNQIREYDKLFIQHSKRWIFWGLASLGVAIGISIIAIFTLQYAGVFPPDAAWCKKVLFGK